MFNSLKFTIAVIFICCNTGCMPSGKSQDNKSLEHLQDDNSLKYSDFQAFCFEAPTEDIETLIQLGHDNPANIDYKIWLTNRYIQTYQFDEARKTAEAAIAINPDDWRGHTVLALVHIQDCRYPADIPWGINSEKIKLAKQTLDKAMLCSADAVFPQILNCFTMAVLESREKALLAIDKFIINDMEPVDVWLWKGRIFLLDDDINYEEACLCYEKTATLSRDASTLWFDAYLEWGTFLTDYVGQLYHVRFYDETRHDETQYVAIRHSAFQFNEKLIDTYPEDYMPYYNMAVLFTYGIDNAQNVFFTISNSSKSLERRETLEAYLSRSQAFHKIKDMESAMNDVSRGVEIASDRLLLSECVEDRFGNTNFVLMWIDECINQEPENGDLYFIRGVVYDKKKDIQQAHANYKKAVELGANKYGKRAQEYLEEDMKSEENDV